VFLWFLGDRLFSILIISGGFFCMLLWCCIILYLNMTLSRNKWIPVTTAWSVLRLPDGGTASNMEVAANIFNKQSRTADKGWSSSLAVGRGANNSSPLKHILLRNVHTESLGLGPILWCELSNRKGTWDLVLGMLEPV
jgi:hypothetical protein